MKLVIEKMRMENFKGCRHSEIEFSEHRTAISGANGTGKSTIVDAFCWALWNVNARGDAPGSDSFREKPLDENGNVMHNLETTVELMCRLDGQRFDIKRTQTENWVKKRGSAEATFQGNVSAYWINGVEIKQAEFKQRIKGIVGDEVFRMVGTLSAFNALEWKKRREMLLKLADADVDGQLLAKDEYRRLADEIADYNVSLDDMRMVLADRRKGVTAELKALPIRIDEAKKSLPQFKPNEIKDAEYIIDDTKKDIEKIEAQILDARAQAGDGSTRRKILALEGELLSVKRSMIEEHDAERKRLTREADAASDEYRRATAAKSEAVRGLERAQTEYNIAIKERDGLRDKFKEVKRKAVNVNTVCPTCGQQMPQDKIEEARARLEEAKAAEIEMIKSSGKRAAQKADEYDATVKTKQEEIEQLEARIDAARTAKEAALKAVSEYPVEPEFESNPRIAEIQNEIEALKAEQAESPDEKVSQLTERKRELLAIVDRQVAVLAKRDAAIETEQRIKAYEARQKDLGVRLSETELLIVDLERFIQERCAALEESINAHFPTVRWKLFDTQINGGITDVCTCMIDCEGVLVPYSSANTASQIRADVEVVDVLSEHYGVRVPLFLDNAERIIDIPEIDCQTITLAVSTDSQLTIKKEA